MRSSERISSDGDVEAQSIFGQQPRFAVDAHVVAVILDLEPRHLDRRGRRVSVLCRVAR